MRTTLQMLVRLVGLLLIVLGVLFWAGIGSALVPVHILLGLLLVAGVWVLAMYAYLAGANRGLALVAVLYGAVVIVFGLGQSVLLTGGAHWVVRVAHLLIGLGAIGIAEMLGARMRTA
jgi:hypothetical protein